MGWSKAKGACFNRTFMELKYYKGWNKKRADRFQSYLYGIEIRVSILTICLSVEFQSYLYGIEITRVLSLLLTFLLFQSYLYGIEI